MLLVVAALFGKLPIQQPLPASSCALGLEVNVQSDSDEG